MCAFEINMCYDKTHHHPQHLFVADGPREGWVVNTYVSSFLPHFFSISEELFPQDMRW